MKKQILIVLLTLIAALTIYCVEETGSTYIDSYITYSDYGSGDIVIHTTNTPEGLKGFWLSPSQPGFKQLKDTIITAVKENQNVSIYYHPDQIWQGSGNKYCKIDAIKTFSEFNNKAAGNYTDAAVSTITRYATYSQYGEGDVVFYLKALPSGVGGFWLDPHDKGFKQTYAAMLSAYHSGKKVRVYYLENSRWPGASFQHGHYYKIYCIEVVE